MVLKKMELLDYTWSHWTISRAIVLYLELLDYTWSYWTIVRVHLKLSVEDWTNSPGSLKQRGQPINRQRTWHCKNKI